MKFVILDILEKYSYTPMDWRQIDEQDKFDMIAKRELEIERDIRLQKKMNQKNK